MAFSNNERERREKAMRAIMQARGLAALILFGDVCSGNDFYGDFRYYTDNRIITSRQVAALFPDKEPVLLVGSAIQRQAASRRSSIRDCRHTETMMLDLAKVLKERGLSGGKVGVNFEVLPVTWHEHLKGEFSGVEWVHTHQEVLEARFLRSPEEADIFRKSGLLADGSFEAAARMIAPGVSEYEIAAAIEGYARARGAEEHFTLIGSGRFVPGDANGLPLPYSPSPRRVEAGDSVVMEITPRVEGYWTQLVRTVNVGTPNPELEKLFRVSRDSIAKGLERLKAGARVKDVVEAITAYVTGCGLLPRPPYGHICGVDLIEQRVSAENERALTAGTAVIIHPTVFSADGKNSFFWGETYLVTDGGWEPLNHASSDLLTV